jgi:ELWxxDGT repeat protein
MKKLTVLLLTFISVNIFAQNFNLIKEINTTATTSSLGAAMMQRVGTTVYFVANNGINGNELWKTDGTTAGTMMVKDINPGAANTIFINFTTGDGLLFFAADDGVHGFEMWRSDGTEAGTFMLRDGFSGCTFCENRLFFHNGYLYFAGDDGTTGAELWKTDGTVAGTVLVKDIFPGPTMSHPAPTSGVNYTFVSVGTDLYFSAVDAVAGRELFKTDGTVVGTVLVKDIFPGGNSGINTVNHKAAAFNGKLYFAATDGVNGIELWATDGTDAGTYLVKDIVAGSGNSQPNNLIEFNGALYFTASSANNAIPDLYKTDGTDAGTVLVRNLVADGITLNIGNSSVIDQFTVANGKLFFRASGPAGLELYATDGTTAGTGIIKDIYPGINNGSPNGLFAFNNNLYFSAIDADMPLRGSALYKSDGTAAGTVKVMDAESGGSLGMSAVTMTSAGGRLFFWGNTNENGIELWSTDGTNANTTLVKDINTIKTGTPNSGANVFGTLVHNGYYYYAAVDDTHGNELWRSDGTTAGTAIVKDIWPGKAPSNPAQFFVYNGVIYFTASNGINGTELWKTDGTETGTVLIADINSGPVNSSPNRFFISNNYFYFTAYHSSYGTELWRSDGTAAGTNMVLDLVTGPANGAVGISDVVSLNNNAYAIMNIPAGNVLGIPSGNRLIKIDGISNTISDFASVVTAGIDLGIIGNTLYITGRNAANQTLLWKSENGGAITQVKILSTTATNAFQLTNCGGKLYFNASNGTANGSEPWISDGTDAGTFMLKDINPGTNPSTPYQFIFSGGKVYFTASSTGNINGEYELWATDGTTAGTYLVKDILPGSTGSRPNSTISAFGNKVLFTANDGASGYELWQSDGTTAGTFLLQEFNTNGDGVPPTGIPSNFPVDYYYSKLGDKIVFFARSADKGLQLYSGSIASPYKYVNDNSRDNDVFTTAVGSNTNNGSQSAPYATLSYAVSQASEGDTIYVDAGLYFEQVTLDKGITLVGAGSGVTIVFKPSVTIPPPGPFQEQGTIQTAQNIGDVHIRDMSVTGDNAGVTPIILQTGGSVKNCRLIGGNQGIFFRVNPAIKTALIENNYINVEYIGINCQGSGLSASLINNGIELTNPFFAAGVFAGLDFGPLVRFTAFGNIIRNYNAQGMLANSYNTNITQNSFTGTGAHAIEQSTNSLGFATCNWYGTTNAATVASKVSGFFSYTPYLTDGTNTITTYGNYAFMPVTGSCSEGVSNFYVNDNSRINDVFTTAVGSNSNAGTRSAPFATLSYAISVAPANSVIHVDAGTYAEQVIIDRAIVINGAGKDLANFIKPATTLVPAPGPFTEIGLFETTQGIGDVHIRNISVNSVDGTSQNIIIQSGGSVKNCKLLNGGQGVFFRYASGSKNAEVSFNTIQPTGIGINCQGAGLTANIVNNTISNPAGYYSGIFAGLDFGYLPQLTITNNKISDYFSLGLLTNANSSNITNNSIVGTASSIAINGNALNATCNWYGTTTPAISGPVIYSPFLTNEMDNNTIELGFQPVPGTCTGVQHKFYVNDNSNVGNFFTTAIGDDNNSGSPSAPLATISAAYGKAQAGDSILLDAGTYTSGGTIAKGITILGTNYLIAPNDVANPLLPNAGRNAESIIINSTFTIGASNINFNGFTFDPGARPQFQQTNSALDFSNINLSNNRFLISSTFTGINLSGRNITPLSSANYTISNNRFEKTAGGNNFTMQLNAINNLNITSNVFVNANSSLDRTQTCISIGNVIKCDNLNITGNHFNAPNQAIETSRIGNTIVDNNKVYNPDTGFILANSIAEPAALTITNNLLQNVRSAAIQSLRNGGADPSAVNKTIIQDNTVIFDGTGLSFGSMIIPTAGSTVVNAEAVIKRNTLTFIGDYSLWTSSSPLGIRPAGRFNALTIDSNEVSFNGVNLPVSAGGTIPTPGILIFSNSGSAATALPSNAVLNINANKVNGFKQSIVFYNAQLSSYGGLETGITANISNNSFIGDSISINNGTSSQTVNANCNWYGSSAAQSVIQKITPATVNYIPWLNSGTDNDPAIGFQPVPGSCNGTAVTVVLTQSTNINCFGQNTGVINITVTGGLAPFTFAWTKIGDEGFNAATEDLSGLTAGTYHLAFADALGSTAALDVTLTEPTAALSISPTGINITCFGNNNGSIVANINGGTTPYTYQWSNGATTSSISGLAPGAYTVVVNDANGCNVSTGYNVTQPALLTVSLTGTSASCNGSVTAAAAAGTTPYTYLWNNGATTQTISNVPAAVYSVTVTDANGCTANGNFTITGNSPINPTTTLVNASCFGTPTGSITVTGAGGVAPHTYNINGSPWQAGNVFSNLPAGTYIIGAKDANGCSDFVTRTITQPVLLTVLLDNTIRPCGSANNGMILITATGGTGGKTYSWTGPNGYTSNTQDPANLFAGIYNLTITDTKGCTANLTLNLIALPQIILTEVVSNVACRGTATGAIDAIVTGGSGTGFTYRWTLPGGFFVTTEDLTNLNAGNYTLLVTDNENGCTITKTYTITQPASLNLAVTKTNVNGCISIGTITGTASGGTVPYQYSIDGTNYQASGLFINVAGGTYSVYVKDANGCINSKVVSVIDNGGDQYEGNNTKNQAKAINVGDNISARIALATDPADWFKFTTTGAGNYILTFTHPSVSYVFNLYAAGNNTPALAPISTTATTKEYVLLANTSYYISITGGLSYTCYNLSIVLPASFTQTNNITDGKTESILKTLPPVLSSRAYPNPHQGSFTLQINSPESGMAVIQLITAEGKVISATSKMLSKGKANTVSFNNIRDVVLLYRIQVGNQTLTGKVLKQN